MSSDPIEVLRELEAKLNRLEDKYREAIKGRDAADPLTNHRLGLAEGFGVAAMCVRDALASLSAPKPESAEAVATVIGYGSDSGDVVEWHREDIAPGTKLYTAPPQAVVVLPHIKQAGDGWSSMDKRWVQGWNACAKYARKQNPNAPHEPDDQPASAPVGDSLVQTALRNLPQYISKSGLVGPDKHSAMQCFEVLRDALAQQPAAVDEATRRDAERYRFLANQHSLWWEEELDAAIERDRAALDQEGGNGGGGK